MYLNVHFLQVIAVSGQLGQCIIPDMMATLGNEASQLVAPITQCPDSIARHQITPGDVQMGEIGTSLRQGMQRDICYSWAAAKIQLLQFVAVKGKTLAGAISYFFAVLKVQSFYGIAILQKKIKN